VLTALAIAVVASLLARTAAARPGFGWLVTVFPAWRFFDRVAASPTLLVRFAIADGALGPWCPLDALRDRTPIGPAGFVSRDRPGLAWAFAPVANLRLAYHAAVTRFVQELDDLPAEAVPELAPGEELAIETDPAVLGLTSYALVCRIARAHAPAGAHVQWKIVVPGDPAPVDCVLSPVLAP